MPTIGFRVLGLLLLFPLYNAADVVECENGDRYNGKVLSMDEKVLKLQNDIHGTLTIPRRQILHISFQEGNKTPAQPAAKAAAKAAGTVGAGGQLQFDPETVASVQNQILGTATPEAQQMFQEMVSGLASGKLTIGDIRVQAQSTLEELKQYQKELGDGEEGELLGNYVKILEGFVGQAPAATGSNTVPKKASPGSSTGSDIEKLLEE